MDSSDESEVDVETIASSYWPFASGSSPITDRIPSTFYVSAEVVEGLDCGLITDFQLSLPPEDAPSPRVPSPFETDGDLGIRPNNATSSFHTLPSSKFQTSLNPQTNGPIDPKITQPHIPDS